MKSQTRQTHNAVITLILLAVTAIYLIGFLWQHKDLYTQRYNPSQFKKLYEQSQWVDPLSKKPIGDDYLYTYAGYRYIQGENPILINPEVPPAGKYLIGLSIVLTGNQRIVVLLAGLISLAMVYLIIKLLSQSSVAAAIGVILTGTHSLFTDQLIHAPQLDLFQLMFLLLFFYSFFLYQKKHTPIRLICTGLLLGLFISIKIAFVFLAILDLCIGLYYLLIVKDIKKSIIEIVSLNVIALTFFVIDYGSFFFHGGNIRSFLGTQKWIYTFYSTSQIDSVRVMGSYIGLILTNSWRVWSTGYPIVHYDQWSFSWPVIFILGIISSLYLIWKKPLSEVVFLFIFISIYNIFLFAVPIFPRYLLLLFVPLHIMIALAISRLLNRYI